VFIGNLLSSAWRSRRRRCRRVSILLVAISGLYMIMKLDGWDRFVDALFWWLDLMVVVWVLFALMVYILEPLVMHRLFHDFALQEKHRAFALATRLHVIALCVSAFTIAAGVLGSLGSLP